MVLKGRLGLETTRVPHADRHGLMWLEHGRLAVESGNLVFTTAGIEELEAGAYEIPMQQISNMLLGPGTVISHNALRILARQQTGVLGYACMLPACRTASIVPHWPGNKRGCGLIKIPGWTLPGPCMPFALKVYCRR